jgi:hypothetical protein
MAIGSGLVAVGTSAVPICSSNQAVLLQNLGTAPVTIGGPGVTVGHGVVLPSTVPTAPAVPATGVVVQNPSAYPVQVAIAANGATITNVTVNGVTVGTAAGTYTVPAGGTISIAYSVATPTWIWTALVAAVLQVPDLGGSVGTGDPIYGVASVTGQSVAFLTATWDG